MLKADEEINAIKDFAKRSGSGHNPVYAHLRNDVSIRGYIRRADEISGFMREKKKILDWGCGYGQMSWLLKNRGAHVVSYTLEKNPPPGLHLLLEEMDSNLVVGEDETHLPFEDNSFDAVLSSGVIEHVVNEEASLKEINRILKPGGFFFIYMLPNRYSYTEFIATLRKQSCHPRKYTFKSLERLLGNENFTIIEKRYSNLFPKNLFFAGNGFHEFYSRFSKLILGLENFSLHLPLLKNISGVFEVVAKKVSSHC